MAPRRIESLLIDGPAGRLEALLEEPVERSPTEAALVCHPHPQYGGTMRNKVVYRLARGLRRTGSVVLRFNYRGVNLSEGSYDHGQGELEDARACLDWLRKRYPDLPFAVAGFSFGARIALQLGCQYKEAARTIAAGIPKDYLTEENARDCRAPRYFIQSTRDEFGPREALQGWYDQIRGEKRILWIAAEDHFFKGGLDLLEEAITRL